MKKTILLFFSLCITMMIQATNPTTLSVVSTAGGLSTAITTAGGTLSTVTNLTVTGTIDARDFLAMRDSMPALSTLNITAVTIAAYTGTQGTYPSKISYVYPANVIPIAAFWNQNTGVKDIITSITLPASVTSIGEYAFGYCQNLTSVTIPSSVTSIGQAAFDDCTALTFITIPSSITSIGQAAFASTGLTSVTIPASVTSIGIAAFEYCSSLTSIYAYPTTPVNLASVNFVFTQVNTTTCTLYVPANSVSLYKAASVWQDFYKIVGTTATATQQIQDNIAIYPNPVINNFNISGLSAPQTLQLFDLNGKLILSQQVDNGTVPASFLQTGIYILKIGNFETKIIKK